VKIIEIRFNWCHFSTAGVIAEIRQQTKLLAVLIWFSFTAISRSSGSLFSREYLALGILIGQHPEGFGLIAQSF
jgi:hypothetical protein